MRKYAGAQEYAGKANDKGLTLAELMVAIMITTAVIGLAVGLLAKSFNQANVGATRADLWGSMTNVSVQLIQDVNDASKITISEPDRLVVNVVRDGRCQTRDWQVDGDRMVTTTTFYDTATCTGGSKERVVDAIKGGLNDFSFTYFSSASPDSPLPTPVHTVDVNRVSWAMAATPIDSTAILRLESGAAFAGRGASSDGTGSVQQALAPYLRITTNDTSIEGVDAPVLTWDDPTPELTQGVSVYRSMYQTGADPTSSTGWEQQTFQPTGNPAPATGTFTDRTLPRGWTALYIVRATVPDGYGPTSNQQATGLRPLPVALTTDGDAASITLSWTASSVGASGYDVYRSEGGATPAAPVLYKRWDDIKGSATKTGSGAALRWTWTDSLAPGQSRQYYVVPVDRWSRLATTGSQTGTLPVGTAADQRFAGGTTTTQRAARALSNLSGAFTAPLAPASTTVALSSTSSATDYGTRISHTPSTAWTGGGPATATDGGGARDRGWEAQRDGVAVSGGETAIATTTRTDTATGPDGLYSYRTRTVNSSGAGAWSADRRIIQRPAVPTCSATPSGLTTRQASVVSGTSSSASSWQVQKLTGPSSAAMGGVKNADGARTVVYGELGHSAAHTWQARSTNVAAAGVAGGGTSDWGVACGATTTVLAVTISDGWSDTRRIDLTLGATGGTAARIEVTRAGAGSGEGIGTKSGVGRHRWDPLAHATTYSAYASNEDGYNVVVTGPVAVGTQVLAAPVLTQGATTTRRIAVGVSCPDAYGSVTSCGVSRSAGGPWSPSGTGFDELGHGRGHAFHGSASDGFNSTPSSKTFNTLLLTVGAPACSMSGGGTAPGTASISAWGGSGAGWYEYSPAQHRSGLSAGTYGGAARSGRSDGYNSVLSGWAACDNSVTITQPAPVIPAGCITTSTGFGGSAGLTVVSASACSALRAQYNDQVIDLYWETRSSNGVTYTGWSPARASIHSGQAASTTAATQVDTAVTKTVQFRVTASNAAGSDSWTVSVTP